jgi:hypothetical protein
VAGINTVPTTSYLTPTTNTLLPKVGMDPVIGASLIGAGGSLISGAASAGGSKKAAKKAQDAAAAQSRAVQQAGERAPFLGLTAEGVAKKHDFFVGGPLDRAKALEDIKVEGSLAFSPNTLAKERMRLAQELAGIRQQNYGKEMDPFARFV